MNFSFHGEDLTIRTAAYQNNGALAVRIEDADGAPYAVLSVNFPESKDLPPDHFYLKDWSENAEIAKAVIETGLVEVANPFLYPPIHSGFIAAKAYTLKEDAIA